MMGTVRLLPAILAALLLVPATAAAQTPPPDERAAAQTLADAAKRLTAAADGVEDRQDWTSDCRALAQDPPARRSGAASAYALGLILRSYLDDLRPALSRFRTDIANAQTGDPALLSGRASVRRIARSVAALPAGEPDPCAAYEAYAKAGYPAGPAREARRIERGLDDLVTRGMERKIEAAADRMIALGVSRADARAFRELSD